MNNTKKLLLSCLVAFVLAGCVTPNEVVYENPPGSGIQQTNVVYAPDPRLIEGIDKAILIHDSLSPVNPYAPLTRPLVDGIGALLIAGAGLLAAFKNKQAKNSASALKTIVDGVESLDINTAALTKEAIGKVASVRGTEAVTKKEVSAAKSS